MDVKSVEKQAGSADTKLADKQVGSVNTELADRQVGSADIKLADKIIGLLNEALELDRAAVAALLFNRVPCSEALANHPTVQVREQHGGYLVGMLGILNGICGADENGEGLIACEFDEPEYGAYPSLVRFVRNRNVKV